MPQIAIIQVAPTQAPAVNTSSPSSSGDFAPHLSQAINNQNQNKESSAAAAKPSTKEADSTQTTDNTTSSDAAQSTVSASDEQDTSAGQDKSSVQLSEANSDAAETDVALQAAAALVQLTTQSANTKISVADNNFFSSLAAKLVAQETEEGAIDQEQLAQMLKTATESTTETTNSDSKNSILAQLQQIIDNSSETGTVTIKSAQAPMTTTFAERSTAAVQASISQPQVSVSTTGGEALSGAVTVNTEGLENLNDTPAEQLTSQRQSTQEQYYDAKLTLETDSDETGGDTQQQSSNGNNSTSSQLQSGHQAGQSTFSSSDTSGVFSSLASQATAQTNISASVDVTSQTLTLPSGNMVNESEILQQITERFQVSQRSSDSHINIKLHPAELGELKIDLTVKDGSIRAHVIAQSQQVQQLIEKNMTKLKETLSEQGFTVEEITVATQSDSVGNFDLFDGEMAQQNEYVPQQSQIKKITASIFQSDEIADLATENIAGVNLTI